MDKGKTLLQKGIDLIQGELPLTYADSLQTDFSKATVFFSAAPNQNYGFDVYTEEKYAIKEQYKVISSGNTEYYVPWKSMPKGKTDKTIATTLPTQEKDTVKVFFKSIPSTK